MTLGRLKAGAALVLTSPFTPMLFQGEEWAASTPFCYLTDYGEPELAQAVREGRRREFAAFGWKPEDIADPQAPESVLRSVLNWSEPDRAPYSDMLTWHRQLVRLRRSEPSLSDGDLKAVQVRFDEARRWLTVERGSITVACNFFADSQAVPAPAGEQRLLLASENGVQLTSHAASLPPDSVAILKRAG
jgi:maltooligosyltrehalose trehalohydrolase